MGPLDDDAFDVVLQGTVHVPAVAFPHLTIKVTSPKKVLAWFKDLSLFVLYVDCSLKQNIEVERGQKHFYHIFVLKWYVSTKICS